MSKLEEFKEKANIRFEGTYTYDKTEYVNCDASITVTCKIHGDFAITPKRHLRGVGCYTCKVAADSKRKRDQFIKSVTLKYGDRFDYSKVVYVGFDIPITIICKEHSEFQQEPSNHKRAIGCKHCIANKRRLSKSSNLGKFLAKAKDTHGDTYDYTNTVYTVDAVSVRCRIHGIFRIKPKLHTSGVGCSKCGVARLIDNR